MKHYQYYIIYKIIQMALDDDKKKADDELQKIMYQISLIQISIAPFCYIQKFTQ